MAEVKKYKNSRLLIFGSISIFCLLFAIQTFKYASIDSSWKKTEGVISNITETISGPDGVEHDVLIKYKVDNQTYEIKSNSYSASMRTGDIKEVYYDPNNPSDSKIKDNFNYLYSVFLALFSVALFAYGIFDYLKNKKRNKSVNRLKENSLKLQGIIKDLYDNSSTTYPPKYSLDATAVTPSGELKLFKSDNLESLGNLRIRDFENNPTPVDILIDPSNYNNYFIDVSSIPEIKPERVHFLIQKAKRIRTENSTPDHT